MKRVWKYLAPMFLVSGLSSAYAACPTSLSGKYVGAGGGTAFYNGGSSKDNFTFYLSQMFTLNIDLLKFGGSMRSSISPPSTPNTSPSAPFNLDAPSESFFYDSNIQPSGTIQIRNYNSDLCVGQMILTASAQTHSFSNKKGVLTYLSYSSTFSNTYNITVSQGGAVLTLMQITPPTISETGGLTFNLTAPDLVTPSFAIELRAQ